jgi:hypothetical protein
MTCVICVVAFAGIAGRSIFNTVIAPILGATLNILMLFGVLYYAITSGGASQTNTIIAGVFSLAWLVIGFGYLYIRKLTTGIPILYSPEHKDEKLKSVEDGGAISAVGGN